MLSVISTLNVEEIQKSGIFAAVLAAAERGNPEFIVEAIKVHYPFLWSTTDDGRSLFFLAVQFRQAKVLNLIHGLVMKHVFANTRDLHSNCLLHMAGLLAPATHLNHISGALLQMQRELQWFKVRYLSNPLRKICTSIYSVVSSANWSLKLFNLC